MLAAATKEHEGAHPEILPNIAVEVSRHDRRVGVDACAESVELVREIPAARSPEKVARRAGRIGHDREVHFPIAVEVADRVGASVRVIVEEG